MELKTLATFLKLIIDNGMPEKTREAKVVNNY